MFLDSNHADDKQTRRSRTWFIVYLTMSLINWYSKRSSTIETSVFFAVFVAIKVIIENLCAIWYKLRIMAILLSGASYIYRDGMSVIHNTSKTESTLKKKYMQLLIMPSMSLGNGSNTDRE